MKYIMILVTDLVIAALITGGIWGVNYDVVGSMDGDGQHLPADMEKLLYEAGENREALIH